LHSEPFDARNLHEFTVSRIRKSHEKTPKVTLGSFAFVYLMKMKWTDLISNKDVLKQMNVNELLLCSTVHY